jgi:hypothetical protein
LGQTLHDTAQVIKVAGQPIHAMHHDRVTIAHEGEQRFQFGPVSVLARRFVREYPGHLDVFQLPFRVLIETANPDIPDALTVQTKSPD